MLTYFIEVAKVEKFTKASENLFISQPTLSRQIKELEDEVGAELFTRKSHSLELTTAGERFLVEAVDVMSRLDHLAHLFDDEHKQTANQLIKLGYMPGFNMGKMYQVLDEFKQSHPTVDYLLNPGSPMQLAEGIARGEYDMIFCLSAYLNVDVPLRTQTFMKNHLQIAVPAHHALSQMDQVAFSQLSTETFILLERQQSPVIVDYVINQGLKNGFKLKANRYVKDLNEGLSQVSTGKGLAFLYLGMNDGSLETKYHIKIVDLQEAAHEQDVMVVMNENNQDEMINTLYSKFN